MVEKLLLLVVVLKLRVQFPHGLRLTVALDKDIHHGRTEGPPHLVGGCIFDSVVQIEPAWAQRYPPYLKPCALLSQAGYSYGCAYTKQIKVRIMKIIIVIEYPGIMISVVGKP